MKEPQRKGKGLSRNLQPLHEVDSGSTEPINSVVPDEDLIDQVVPDGEELE